MNLVEKIKGNGNDSFKEELAMSESSNNYDVVNKQGYMGKYQFGEARLTDFKDANKDYNFTSDEFINNPGLQEDVMMWHVDDINSYIDSRELDKYIGKKIGGVTITREGLIAGAHLGGRTGLMKFLNGGMKIHGEQDKHDGSEKEPGTYISDYIMKFS